MDATCTQTLKVAIKSDAELHALVRRLEDKWQRRRRAHPFAGFML